jgi:hypothetical protein
MSLYPKSTWTFFILLTRSKEKGLMKSLSMSFPIRAKFFCGWSGRHGQDIPVQGTSC